MGKQQRVVQIGKKYMGDDGLAAWLLGRGRSAVSGR